MKRNTYENRKETKLIYKAVNDNDNRIWNEINTVPVKTFIWIHNIRLFIWHTHRTSIPHPLDFLETCKFIDTHYSPRNYTHITEHEHKL